MVDGDRSAKVFPAENQPYERCAGSFAGGSLNESTDAAPIQDG
jgi:hypothetical protein